MQSELTQIKKEVSKNSKTLANHSKVLNMHSKILTEHSKTLGEHTRILNDHSDKFERVFKKLLEHDEEFRWIKENMATKDDFMMILDGQDKLITLFKNLDQERWFTVSWLRRVEGRVDAHDTEIKGIKKQIAKA